MTLPRLFGTDGIRGSFGTFPLDEPTVRRLGDALGRRLAQQHETPHVVLGGDTRHSTPVLSRWLSEALRTRITYLGTVPTPAVAHVTRQLGASCGVAISASHNPHPDNGIKLIDARGFKWSTLAEAELEADLEGYDGAGERDPKTALDVLDVDQGAVRGYLAALTAAVRTNGSPAGRRPLQGLAVALDTGHGAASGFAEELFAGLGARVTLVHAAPNGENINAGCGSTYPRVIAELTRESRSDLGFSFDGDADRVILADEAGQVRDGDAILYLWAKSLDAHGALPGRRVVATSMSNLGLEVAFAELGIELLRCDVGDRVVVRTMRDEGAVLGGEQSGHIVNLELSTTGDGLLTALAMARLRAEAGRPLSEMIEGLERYPQLIRNVRVREKIPFEDLPEVLETSRRIERQLGDRGRLVLRYSGTEPLARIMLEGRSRQHIESLAADLAAVIAMAIGDE